MYEYSFNNSYMSVIVQLVVSQFQLIKADNLLGPVQTFSG